MNFCSKGTLKFEGNSFQKSPLRIDERMNFCSKIECKGAAIQWPLFENHLTSTEVKDGSELLARYCLELDLFLLDT